ncbi:hypothetical protein Q8A67_022792 [Cirrhinus molitorella]|uniref:Uncharacterized protein n=1 Tax=Cirrhinus molitorella TaxID=172907 RepID=A0AA88P5S7_9TELE|nr:hypothetical protein Q8A67_022792 [Cirrhinus molitorella]
MKNVISRVGSGEGYSFLLFNGGRLGEFPAEAHNKPTEQPYARSAVRTLVREDLKVFWIFSCTDLAPNEKSPIKNCGTKALLSSAFPHGFSSGSYLELLSPCISSSYLYLHLQLSLAPPLTNISVLDVPPTLWQRQTPLPGSRCCS